MLSQPSSAGGPVPRAFHAVTLGGWFRPLGRSAADIECESFMRPLRAYILAGLTVGSLDILDAFTFFGLRSGVRPARILQSISAGLLGRASFDGGVATAALGLFLHFFIAFAIVGVYFLVARAIPGLTRRPFLTGPLYGLAAYGVMNYVVIPLSAAASRGGAPPPPVLLNGLLIHAFGVGLPAALFARKAFGRR
jgi:hypothetical protein